MSTSNENESPLEVGIRAFLAGEDVYSNPYKDGSLECSEWTAGWQVAAKLGQPGRREAPIEGPGSASGLLSF